MESKGHGGKGRKGGAHWVLVHTFSAMHMRLELTPLSVAHGGAARPAAWMRVLQDARGPDQRHGQDRRDRQHPAHGSPLADVGSISRR